MTPNSRSYLNQFTQPDTIIPDLSNPQGWNRYSYVQNNPIGFADPSGHMRTGERCGLNGEQCDHLGVSSGWIGHKITPPSPYDLDFHDRHKPWVYDENIILSTNISAGPIVAPDYNGDYPDDTNVPYLPGVSPGRYGPLPVNPCYGTAAAIFCLAALFTSIVPPADSKSISHDNFSLSFNASYQESYLGLNNITISNMQFNNQNVRTALRSYKFNDSVTFYNNTYMPRDGEYHPIPAGGTYAGDNRLLVNFTFVQTVQGSNGPADIPKNFFFLLPSVPDVKSTVGQ